ncbi:MAG TPA: YeaH/YhbH family protein [Candidatus Paceibacterota bacterium]|nr:YeaH/YhbH family protein [Candidatus Paceibacterota bacterium]
MTDQRKVIQMPDGQIIDRRSDSGKSDANRRKFMKRFNAHIRERVQESIDGKNIDEIDIDKSGEEITIKRGKHMSEPSFRYKNGKWIYAGSGNDHFGKGDELARPKGGQGGSGPGSASDSGESEDDFVFQISREEFLKYFFEDLELPDMVRKALSQIDEYKWCRAGFTNTGSPANLSILRTMRHALGRRLGCGLHMDEYEELCAILEELTAAGKTEADLEFSEIVDRIAELERKIEVVPFLDTTDQTYHDRTKIAVPTTRAVMFCLMDVSGSMDEEKKQIAKRFFMLLYLFLTKTYEHIEVIFLRHHTTAKLVDEDEFFYGRESGGTIVSSVLKLMLETIEERKFNDGTWNIYTAQASDGDNWDNDSPICRDLLIKKIMKMVQYFAYVEITTGDPQNLWREYEKVKTACANFAMQRIKEVRDIYPVFQRLFRKRIGTGA